MKNVNYIIDTLEIDQNHERVEESEEKVYHRGSASLVMWGVATATCNAALAQPALQLTTWNTR